MNASGNRIVDENKLINGFLNILQKEGIRVVGGGDMIIDGTNLATEATLRSISADYLSGVTRTFTYYTGVEAGNPSGSKNVKTIVYSGTVSLTQTFTYDSADDVLTIVNS